MSPTYSSWIPVDSIPANGLHVCESCDQFLVTTCFSHRCCMSSSCGQVGFTLYSCCVQLQLGQLTDHSLCPAIHIYSRPVELYHCILYYINHICSFNSCSQWLGLDQVMRKVGVICRSYICTMGDTIRCIWIGSQTMNSPQIHPQPKLYCLKIHPPHIGYQRCPSSNLWSTYHTFLAPDSNWRPQIH